MSRETDQGSGGLSSEEARRIVAEAVLVRGAPPEDATADDLRALLVEALDLGAYLAGWAQDFGASVQLVFGALPVGAGLPAAPSAADIVREWRLGDG